MRLRFPLAAAAAFAAAALLGGCQSWQDTLQKSDSIFGVITPYKVEIVQGNVVTKEQVEVMRPGMTRTQVRDVIGTALVADPFHLDRWDYVFTIRRQGAAPQRRHVVVVFDGDRMKSIEGAEGLPSEREFVASIDSYGQPRRVPPLELTPEQLQALPVPPRAEPAASPAAPAPAAPARSYPPLEPR